MPRALLAVRAVAQRLTLGLLLCSTAARAGAQPPKPGPALLVLEDVSVVPMDRARTLEHQRLVVEGGRIRSLGPAGRGPLPAGAQVVDGRGLTVLPGLWDSHVHAWDAHLFSAAYLAAGIVGVRDMGSGLGPPFPGASGALAYRDAVRAGRVLSPLVVTPGLILEGGRPTASPYGFFRYLDTPDSGRRWVDSLAGQRVDFIKVYSSLAPDVFAAVAEQARRHRLRVAGHVPFSVGAEAAARQGLASAEHLTDLLVACTADAPRRRAELIAGWTPLQPPLVLFARYRARVPDLANAHDAAACRRVARTLQRAGTHVTPTLRALRPPALEGGASVVDSVRLRALPRAAWPFVAPRDTLPLTGADRAGRVYAAYERVVRVLWAAGVPLLAGSDSPNPGSYPGAGLHDELALLVRAGVPVFDALRSATRTPARFHGFGRSHGLIRAGFAADFVLLGRNPLADIAAVADVRAVVRNGQLLDRAALDAYVREQAR